MVLVVIMLYIRPCNKLSLLENLEVTLYARVALMRLRLQCLMRDDVAGRFAHMIAVIISTTVQQE